MCHIWEVHVKQVLKTLVCAQVFMSGVTIPVCDSRIRATRNRPEFCRILAIVVKFTCKCNENLRKLFSNNVWGRACRWNCCSIPSFWVTGKSCWKRKHIWQTSSSSGTGTMDKLEVYFLPYLVQEFLEVSTSLHIRFLSRSPCITS